MARKTRTVADAAWAYYQYIEPLASRTTSQRYRSNLLDWLELYGSRSIETITEPELFAFVHGEQAHPSPHVRTSRNTVLNGIMAYAAAMGWCRTIKVPPAPFRHTAPARQWTRYSALELRLLKDAAPCERSRIAISLASHTGMRIEDIQGLPVPAANLEDRWLNALIRKSQLYDFKVITTGLQQDLRRYLDWLPEPQSDGYLIPAIGRLGAPHAVGAIHQETFDFSRPLSLGTLGERLVKARKDAGLSHLPRERWHAIRRSSGRLFFEAAAFAGYDSALRMTQAFLNHASVTTTEKYIGLSSAYQQRDDFLMNHDFLEDNLFQFSPTTQERVR